MYHCHTQIAIPIACEINRSDQVLNVSQQVLASQPELFFLSSALSLTGFQSSLPSPSLGLTIFAPSNAAFLKLLDRLSEFLLPVTLLCTLLAPEIIVAQQMLNMTWVPLQSVPTLQNVYEELSSVR